MKRNVDLTENMDFRDLGQRNLSDTLLIDFLSLNLHDFQVVHSDIELNGILSIFDNDKSFNTDINELVLTGNSIQRKYKRMERNFCTPYGTCDRCGTNILWGGNGGLCYECSVDMIESSNNVINKIFP